MHEAIARPLALLARSRDDAVMTGGEDAVGELDGSIAEDDYGAAGLGLHPVPFARDVGLERHGMAGLGPDLQPTEPIHEDGDPAPRISGFFLSGRYRSICESRTYVARSVCIGV